MMNRSPKLYNNPLNFSGVFDYLFLTVRDDSHTKRKRYETESYQNILDIWLNDVHFSYVYYSVVINFQDKML